MSTFSDGSQIRCNTSSLTPLAKDAAQSLLIAEGSRTMLDRIEQHQMLAVKISWEKSQGNCYTGNNFLFCQYMPQLLNQCFWSR